MTIRMKMALLAILVVAGQLLVFGILYGDLERLAASYLSLHGAAADQKFVNEIMAVWHNALMEVAVIVPLVLAGVFWIAWGVARGVRRLRDTMEEAVRDRNLTLKMEVVGRDELAGIAGAYNALMDEFCRVMTTLRKALDRLQSASGISGEASGALDEAVAAQGRELDQLAAAINQMAATAQEISRNAAATLEAAEKADVAAESGREVVRENETRLNALADEVDRTSAILDRLSEESSGIAAMLNSIRGIAEQTNLLALNAAIEAARAGAQGRGFAVVADELRTLAQRTQDSTSEIEQVVDRVLGSIREAVEAMASGQECAQSSVAQAKEVNAAFERIRESVSAAAAHNREIAVATEQQGEAAEEINRGTARLADAGAITADCAVRVGEAARAIEEACRSMVQAERRFRS